ncbi:MAG: phage terminase large subunit [Bacteroidota bacterium]
MKIKGSANLEFLLDNYDLSNPPKDHTGQFIKKGFVLEGASGSGKTQDAIRFIAAYCQYNQNKGKRIFIFRQKYSDCRETVLEDFIKFLKDHDLYDQRNHTMSHPQRYQLFGNTIRFAGLDNMGSHGKRNDLIYGNEAMEIEKEAFKQINQRTNEIFILDYNPSVTDHWVYDEVIPRDDTKTFRSWMLINPFLPKGQRDEILRYEPWHPEDRKLPEKERRPHPTNIEQGTANQYLWKVYGLGERAAPEGLIFPVVTWIKEFPKNIELIHFGSDFGKTNSPSTIVKLGVLGTNLYLEKLLHAPTPTPTDYIKALEQVCKTHGNGIIVWADSAEPGYISDSRTAGYNVYGANKFSGSISYGISLLQKFKIHIVDCPEWRKEQSNYVFKKIHGFKLDEPIDDFNHLWDAARYAALHNLRGE